MFKLIFIGLLGYFFYRLFIVPRALNSPDTNSKHQDPSIDDDEWVEYEEVD